MIRISLILLLLVSSARSEAQTDFLLGTGVVENGDNDRPAAYATNWRSAKYQYTITAEELQAVGMGAGIIQAIAFDVVSAAPHAVEGFTLSMGEYGGSPFNFTEGLQLSYGPLDYQPTDGWNTHTFDTPFIWDGVSDLVLESCFANEEFNSGYDNTINRSTEYTDFGIVRYSDYSGANDACDEVEVENFLQTRPNMRITAISTEVAPTAGFSILDYSECSGTLSLQDGSYYTVDEWLWYFGDGSTSEAQHPSHTYEQGGVFDISLLVTNEYGRDSITVHEAITVDLPDALPLPAGCMPQTQNQTAGFGPIDVQVGNLDNSSSNGSAGYESFTCLVAELTAGQAYDISVSCDGSAPSIAVAWIDYNGDGEFSPQEKILAQQTADVASTSFTVPATALSDSLIRLRVAADFYLNGELGPCDDPTGGQVEDYSVRITPNTLPPIPIIDADATMSCDGIVHLVDLSQNAPDSWLWTFGDGESSTEQHPVHSYAESGTYTVSLMVTNAFGQEEATYTDFITVDLTAQVVSAACQPSTSEYCCGYGIISVDFAGLDNQSENGSVGYEDFTCGLEGTLTEGRTFPYTLLTGGKIPHDLSVYLDGDDNGQFDAGELIHFSANAMTHTGSIDVPDNVDVTGSRIRLRFAADYVGNMNSACTEPLFGQVEDYAVIVLPDTLPPEAAFMAAPTLSCDGLIDFADMSTGSVDSVIWYFGDGVTATGDTVSHLYSTAGIYTVSLVALNGSAQDSVAYEDYVTVDLSAVCDTLAIPFAGALFSTDCEGILTDDGIYGDYSDGMDGQMILGTDAGNSIRLEFSDFSFLIGDSLVIYDGVGMDSPVLGTYSGSDLPGGGVITSSTASMTIRQKTDASGTSSGFLANWSCQALSLTELVGGEGATIYPVPASDLLYVRQTDPADRIISIDVTDAQGRVVLSRLLDRRSELIHTLDISALAAGHYQLAMIFDTHRTTSRLVISR